MRYRWLFCLLLIFLPWPAAAAPEPSVEQNVQAFLDQQPGPLKAYREGEATAAQIINGTSAYYGTSPRILLALLEATAALLSNPNAAESTIQQPFGAHGPPGFAAQIDWAARELQAGLGPYETAPTLTFTDGTTITLTLAQAAEGVAVQRFLAAGRTRADWRAAVDRFGAAFLTYFNNELPQVSFGQASSFVLRRPWAVGTRVRHLAYFDHAYPTVDSGRRGNGYVIDYLGRGGVQYDGHDGHDYHFPDLPIGTYIYAAADGVAYASTHRGNGVWIEHIDGYVTVYWHLDKFARKFRGLVNTSQGIPVKAGDLIGSSGRSGFVGGTPHLHFEVRRYGRQVDPYGWYGNGPDPCPAYAGCAPSRWLWAPELRSEFDFTPPR
jgi:murein DD-endopeptidase MepM/ murein hydrolase activator NlpD